MPRGIYPREAPSDRFERSYIPEPNTGCFLWTGAVNHKGYGVFTIDGKSISAHRASWELSYGEIPSGAHILHRCDTPACVNPRHLFPGTAADNMADKVAKGRAASGDANGARLRPDRLARGEAHGQAKLTAASVRAIRAAVDDGTSMRSLARRFGVSPRTIGRIAKATNWTEVD